MITDEIEIEPSQSHFAEAQANGLAATEPAERTPRSLSPRSKIVFASVLLLLALAAGGWYFYTQNYESTDDAQVDGHINVVSSRISGTVARVYFDDNQSVQAGQTLVDLDTRELTIADQQNVAQYAQALAQLNAEKPNVAITQNTNVAEIAQAQSKVENAKAALEAAEHDRQSAASKLVEAKATANRDQLQSDRYKQLYEKDETSRQEFENYTAAAQASSARLAAAEAELASAEKVIQQRQAQVNEQITNSVKVGKNAPHELAVRLSAAESQRASVQLARAEWDRAKLNLSYARIEAPISGIVTQRSVEPGNRVAEGEQLMMLVNTADLWVTANFKETQLAKMRPGCRASVKVDALGRSFEGAIESLPAITGSRASVLPPENATGNYVKVVQRLPVRIRLNPGQPQISLLRPGMSVDAKVYVK